MGAQINWAWALGEMSNWAQTQYGLFPFILVEFPFFAPAFDNLTAAFFFSPVLFSFFSIFLFFFLSFPPFLQFFSYS
jgi:hypothetical protein